MTDWGKYFSHPVEQPKYVKYFCLDWKWNCKNSLKLGFLTLNWPRSYPVNEPIENSGQGLSLEFCILLSQPIVPKKNSWVQDLICGWWQFFTFSAKLCFGWWQRLTFSAKLHFGTGDMAKLLIKLYKCVIPHLFPGSIFCYPTLIPFVIPPACLYPSCSSQCWFLFISIES